MAVLIYDNSLNKMYEIELALSKFIRYIQVLILEGYHVEGMEFRKI